jgi:ATP-dependent Lhr-like helicase
MVASDEPEWTATRLYDFVRRAYPWHALSRSAFDETVAMLSGKYPADVASELDPRIFWDRASDTLTPARGARMVATISGGTIPDRGLYTVNLPDKTRLGELDEEFVVDRARPGGRHPRTWCAGTDALLARRVHGPLASPD